MPRSTHSQGKNAKKSSSFSTRRTTCDICRRVHCYSLHNYTAASCPFQTCDICINLAKIDEEILNVQNLLFELSKKRQEIKEMINSRHDRLISRFPVEIMSLIFSFSVDSNHGVCYQGPQKRRTWVPVVLLGAVSKGWRHITLGVPQLWTTAVIDPRKDSARVETAREWLDRSRALPLSITFKGGHDTHDQDSEIDPRALKLFKSTSVRWKNVTFEVPLHIIYDLLDGVNGIHEVDSLIIDPPTGKVSELDIHKGLIQMCDAFHPKTLYARNCSLANISIQWDNLTRIDISFFCLDELLHILRHGTRLLQCKVESIKLRDGKAVYKLPSKPFVNQSLTHIITQSSSLKTNFLRYITIPSLTEFDYTYQSFQNTLDILSDFLNRSGVPLHFTFSYWMDNDNGAAISYTDLPLQITHLKLNITRMDQCAGANEFMTILAYDGEGAILLPNIRTLEISTDTMTRSIWTALSNVFPITESEDDNLPQASDMLASQATASVAQVPDFIIQRPWVTVRVRIRGRLYNSDTMDKGTLTRFLNIRKSGVELDLRDVRDVDLLQLAAEYHTEMSDPEVLASGESDG